jgi:hypothetical protein
MTATESSHPSHPDGKGHSLILNVGVQVEKKGIPTEDFELVDIDATGLIHPRPRLEIDLSTVDQDVLIVFQLLDTLGLQFPERADDCIGLNRHDYGCPQRPTNAVSGLFAREGMSRNRRQLAIRKKNIADGKEYLFALFLNGSDDRPAAVCDPRIINR